MKILPCLMVAAASTRIAAAPGEEAVATAMSMPTDEVAAEEKLGKDEGKEKGVKDEEKEKDAGKDEKGGKDKDAAKVEETNVDANGTADTLSENSATDFGSNFAIHAMGVTALTVGLWF